MMPDLTVPQAALLLKLAPRSVRMFIERGMIKGEKRGRDWFITQDEVDRYTVSAASQVTTAANKPTKPSAS